MPFVRVFISHASADKPIIELFSKHILRLGLGLALDDIFCTCLEGTKIKTGEDFRDAIRDALHECEIVLLIITPHYKQSEVCLNEMGAAWVSDKPVLPLIVGPINYRSVGALMKTKQATLLADKDELDELRDQLVDELGLEEGSTSDWNKQNRDFRRALEKVLEATSFKKPIDAKEFADALREREELAEEVAELNTKVEALQSENEELAALKDHEEVAEVRSKYDDSTLEDQFLDLCHHVTAALGEFSSVVGAILLCSHYEQPYSPDWRAYEPELHYGRRQGFLGERFRPRQTSTKVQELFDALDAVDEFVNSSEQAIEFHEWYEEQDFRAELNTSLESFWEEHYEARIPSDGQ